MAKAAAKKSVKQESGKPATVLVLRTCAEDGSSHNGFKWPLSGPVEAKDWKPTKECGDGLHGWLWGHGDWSLKNKAEKIHWLVVEVEQASLIDLGGKVKYPKGNVIANFGHWADAMAFIRARRPAGEATNVATGDYGHASATGDSGHATATGYSGHASATGNYGHASATGYSGHASATGNYGHASATGDYGHASATGDYGHASATGDSGHASATGNSGHASATGDYGHASATGDSGHASATGYSGHASATGYSGHASATGNYGHASATGNSGWAIAGYGGTAKADKNGALTLLWFDQKAKRPRVAVAYVGEDGIKPNTEYRVDDKGRITEVSQ